MDPFRDSLGRAHAPTPGPGGGRPPPDDVPPKRDTRLVVPEPMERFLAATIAAAGGNEVYFLGRVSWSKGERGPVAKLDEVDVVARGNRVSAPAIVERAENWDIALHNHPSGNLEPSDADYTVAHELASRSVGFAILANDASRYYLVIPPFKERQREEPIDLDEVRRIFSAGGPLRAELEDYELREGQLAMSLAVARSLNEGRVLAAEAGTGVGKSFAYLVPSILWAVKNRERVVVSTGTINLQEQLVSKDLPFLAKVLGIPFEFALIKGRGNYGCRRKIRELRDDFATKEILSDARDTAQLRDLVEWAGTTGDGSRSDLGWIPPAQVWERIMSETDKSLKVNCDHYQDCFYYQAKRQAFKAQVLVVNHHLFFSDLSVRRQLGNYEYDLILPRYRRVVFDEAHHLEDVASDHLGIRFSRLGIYRRLSRLISPKSGRGIISSLIHKLRGLGDRIAPASIERAFSTFIENVLRIDEHFHEIEDRLHHEILEGNLGGGGSRGDVQGGETGVVPSVKVRYKKTPQTSEFWRFVVQKLADVRQELGVIGDVSDRAASSVKSSTVREEKRRGLLLELTSFSGRLEQLIEQIEDFSNLEDDRFVRWLVTREGTAFTGEAAVGFATAPVRVAAELKGSVYEPLESIVLASATLCVDGRVDFLGDRLGLADLGPERFRFEEYPSPFDFKRQVLTVVPTDFPEPGSAGFEASVPDAVYRLVRASGGRAFVLFTSYSLLKRTHAALDEPLRSLGLRSLVQGQADRSELLSRFRNATNCVLFGTDSFWEGVDVKGRALECVIITRLPFRVPSEPVQEARMEELEARGKNPFSSFTVPQAVLKLKQGFGRLIRSTTDRGVVAVLDRRILTKFYGRVFLRSLPETRLERKPLADVVASVEEFFRTGDQ